jgi:hypothetical protein
VIEVRVVLKNEVPSSIKYADPSFRDGLASAWRIAAAGAAGAVECEANPLDGLTCSD